MAKSKLRWLFVVLVCFWGDPRLYADCKARNYQVGKIFEQSTTSVVLTIAIEHADFAPETLVCLANDLKKTYSAPEVVIGIFSSYEAALDYSPPTGQNDTLWASQQHAVYFHNSEKREDYLLLMPDGLSMDVDSPFNTRIDFPVTGRPSCKLQIRDRCLIEFDHISPPGDETSATVSLIAQIEKSGEVSNVRIVGQDPNSPTHESKFADFAVRNLKTWRFEPGRNTEEIKIVYSLEHVDSPFNHDVNVKFTLPDKVNIQIGSLLIPRR